MRLVWAASGAALAAFWLFPAWELAAALLGLLAVALLPVIGYRERGWGLVGGALAIPAAAIVADVLIFTPLTLQPDVEPAFATYAAVLYTPLWAALIALGAGARRLSPDPPMTRE